MNETETKKSLFFGLDLGQAMDYTALAIIEKVEEEINDKEVSCEYNCVHLQRWHLKTPYPAIVVDVARMINGLPENSIPHILAVDATGVGAPVVDLFKREKIKADLKPIQIIGGADVTREPDITRVPKRDLVSVVQVGLQNQTFKIASALPEAATLVRELQNFQVKITDAANDTYGAWRSGTHDDLVLAAALALWSAQNFTPFVIPKLVSEIFRRRF